MCRSRDSELKERLTLRHYVLFIQFNLFKLPVSYHKAKSQWSLYENQITFLFR